ncbi:hypothetical protein JV173_01955 [Acholeplasma equirhinis]|uniref:hypothetical protein n=1 Tax=Acholeplasma equirhinis TaxID=555393 RepID=UPI00197AB286|nr:hypothetical protein [Acholeplasma equirhinis]MBN3490269.1 hypothetical protein [Acholeplasma equirhinis]
MKKLQRLGDILYAFDSEEVFGNLKLKGDSALQFLVKDINLQTVQLDFDFHSDVDINEVNNLRNKINELLPIILLKKNFAVDLKKSQITGSLDRFLVVDQTDQTKFTLTFDYLNRRHILGPEYFARKDEMFTDLHLNCLSTLENYAIYFLSLFQGNKNTLYLKSIIDNQKIMPQQYPFIRKMIAFYYGLSDFGLSLDVLNFVDKKYHPFLNEIINFNEKELQFISDFRKGIYDPTLILPGMLGTNLVNHPKAKLVAKRRLNN